MYRLWLPCGTLQGQNVFTIALVLGSAAVVTSIGCYEVMCYNVILSTAALPTVIFLNIALLRFFISLFR